MSDRLSTAARAKESAQRLTILNVAVDQPTVLDQFPSVVHMPRDPLLLIRLADGWIPVYDLSGDGTARDDREASHE